jgi:hypothetical protein
MMMSNVETANGTGGKKQDKKKKVDSMVLAALPIEPTTAA